MMNILENIEFQTEKANVLRIKKNEKINFFTVALGKDAVLKKHKTPVPATLVVLKGEIHFTFKDREYDFRAMDTFEIPVDEEHEVIGVLNENLFTILQEY